MKRFSVLIMVAAMLAACNNNEAQKKAIESKEKALMDQTKKGKVDTTGVNELLKSYLGYAEAFPADTNGANYLFKAADFYRYMRKPLRSIELYAKIYNNYPTFQKRPYALFLQGFIFENEVGNLDSAKVKYQQFLAVYPDHAIAHDVKITLNNLGKRPEQLIQEFQAKQLADSAKTNP